MNLYLFNQKRNRDLNEYLDKLCISTEDFLSINSNEKKILLVGGGNSTIQEYFAKKTKMNIVNVDFDPPQDSEGDRIRNIKADFVADCDYKDEFDEIWALYSLPLYSPSKEMIYKYILKALLALKPEGVLRFFPIEYDKNEKLKTKDADYDMATMENTRTVLKVLDSIKEYGVEVERVRKEKQNINRIEEAAILTNKFEIEEKNKFNLILEEDIKKYSRFTKVIKVYSKEEKSCE